MNKKLLEESFRDFYPTIYSLSFALVPEVLQAEQICLDVLELLGLRERRLMRELAQAPSNKQCPSLIKQLQISALGYAWGLGVKRFGQLKDGLRVGNGDFQEAFYLLGVIERGVLFLKMRLKLNLSDIEFISGHNRYEILSSLARSRDHLLQAGQGRSMVAAKVIGD